MTLAGAPRLRRQGARRRVAVRQAIEWVSRTLDARAWSLTPVQYARFLDLYFAEGGASGLDEAERGELDQLWAWYVAGFAKPAVDAWARVPGPLATRPPPQSPPPAG